MWNSISILHSSAIESKYGIVFENAYQSEKRIEWVIECQIEYWNECETECEIWSQTGYEAESVTECRLAKEQSTLLQSISLV